MRGWQTSAPRSRAATLATLKRDPGKERIGHLDHSSLIDHGKMRADQGAGPVTLSIDIGVIKMIITQVLEAHGVMLLRKLGEQKGILGQIFSKAQNKIADPASCSA